MLVDWTLIITIGLIFLVTLLGAWLRSRRRDSCLVSFDGYQVTLELDNKRLVWGLMEVTPTGLEFLYRTSVRDDEHLEASYVLYGQEYARIQAIYRYADELSPENQRRRAKAIKRTFHPGPMRYLGRQLRNFINTAAGSLNEVISLLIGRAKQPAGRYITETSDRYLQELTTNVIGHVGREFDPLLERFVGQKVVIELAEHDEIHEHVGIFKNYSPDFLEILDVQFPVLGHLQVTKDGYHGSDAVMATFDASTLRVINQCEQPILLQEMTSYRSSKSGGNPQDPLINAPDAEETEFNIVIDSGMSVDLMPEPEYERFELQFKVVRELDMIVPRTRCVVRHRAEPHTSVSLTDLIFDMGILLSTSQREKLREERLREQLVADSQNATAAAALGGLLLRNRNFDEAEKWLLHALTMRNSLADNGQRVRMNLRELARRRNQGFSNDQDVLSDRTFSTSVDRPLTSDVAAPDLQRKI